MTSSTHHPHVFVSYTHDSPEHSQWVLKLASDLRASGVDAFLDVWDLRPGEDFARRIASAAQSADHLLVICTPRYRKVAEQRRTHGVGYESQIIDEAFLERSKKTPRIIPVIRAGDGKDALPDWLVDRKYLDLRDDKSYKHGFSELLGTLLKRDYAVRTPTNAVVRTNDFEVELSVDFAEFDESEKLKLLNAIQSLLGSGVTIKGVRRG